MTETTAPPPSDAVPGRQFFASRGWRFAVLIALTLAMFVPLILISFVIEDRVSYRRAAISEIAQTWGGPIQISGPMIVIPVEVERTRLVKDAEGLSRSETYRERGQEIILRPETLSITADARSEIRRRGIFEVPVFASDMSLSFDFDAARVTPVIRAKERVLWDRARLVVILPPNRSFRGNAVLESGRQNFDLEPGTGLNHASGIQARIGDPRALDGFRLSLGLNGAERVMFSPEGRLTTVSMTSDWAHPSFDGGFLPKTREVTEEGFTAEWEIPHLARDAAQVSRGYEWSGTGFGVRFYNPVDFYQKVQRAVKYGIMFIALTFLTVFLSERLSGRAVHAVQFLLIGIAQCVFFLLLLSVAEQVGFTLSYLLAGAATIGLIGLYARNGLGLGKRGAWSLVGALGVLYGVLYLILRSTDYALLAGSILAFIAVALVMLMTGREDWSGSGKALRPA